MLSKTKMEKKIVENGKAVFHNNVCYPKKMGKSRKHDENEGWVNKDLSSDNDW